MFIAKINHAKLVGFAPKQFWVGFFIISFLSQFQIYSQSIQLTGEQIYTQNFNSLANTGESSSLPIGWYFIETGLGANTLYSADDGDRDPADTKSYGTSETTDRAFGTLRMTRTGSLVSTIGASFTNNTGVTITQLPISYTGEQWRRGNGTADTLNFQLSTNATSLNTGTWTDYDMLDFSSLYLGPFNNTKLDGNLSSNRISISFTIIGLSIPNGATFWIRWLDSDKPQTDDGLAIDDFVIDETALPVELSSFTAKLLQSGGVQLDWRTETEVDNYGFEILRRVYPATDGTQNASSWVVLDFVEGHGNSNSPKEYTFTDKNVQYGQYAYRLKQIDTDGDFEYSDIIEVDAGNIPDGFVLEQNYPNPFNPSTTIKFALAETQKAELKVFDILGNEIVTLFNSIAEGGKVYEVEFNSHSNSGQSFRLVRNLSSGIYFYRLVVYSFGETENKVENRKMMLIK